MCETIDWMDKTNDDMATSLHIKADKVVDKGFCPLSTRQICVKRALGPFHTYLSTRWWTKLFVYLIVWLDVEGSCHVIIGFVHPMNGFTHGNKRPVESDL